jgi:hypothetical protein
MNRRGYSISAFLSLSLLPPVTADAQVIKVVPTPAMTLLNAPVVIEVTGGRVPCAGLEIDFNDGLGPQKYAEQQLPFQVSRSWPDVDSDKLPNTKVVKARGIGCGGEATATVTVLEELKLVPRPKIETYFGFATPGGAAGIVGSAFGAKQGKVQARLKDWKGGLKVIDLNIIEDPNTGVPEWKPALIGVEWPSELAGFPFQDAAIWVARPDGKSSSEHKVQFKPTLELKVLPQQDVKVVSCSGDANFNGCNGAGGKGDACVADSAPFLSESDASISGRHYNCWAAIGDDSGTDTYQVTLANGWALEELIFEKFVEAGEGWVKSPASTFSAGATQWTAKVAWSVTPNDDLRYEALAFIRGPKGVPHK